MDDIRNARENFRKQLEKTNKSLDLGWDFILDLDFDKIIREYIKSYDLLDYVNIHDTSVSPFNIEKMKIGDVHKFSKGSKLTKLKDNFVYKNKRGKIFGPHSHEFNEEAIPKNNDILYFLLENEEWKVYEVKSGESFIVPKYIHHAGIIPPNSEIIIKWF